VPDRRRVFDLHRAAEDAARQAGEKLRSLLRPSDPDYRGGSGNPDLMLSPLPVDLRLCLTAIWTGLTQPQFEYRLIDPGTDHDRWEKRLADALQALGGRPVEDVNPFAALLRFAAENLKGEQRQLVELVCQGHPDSGTPPGQFPLRDLAFKFGWPPKSDKHAALNAWDTIMRHLNRKLPALGYRLCRHDGNATLRPTPAPQKGRT
jgi:hypothetical protein